MDYPVRLPQQIRYVEHSLDEDDLFQLLVAEPLDLICFLEYAADDVSWLAGHHALIHRLLDWLTTQFYREQLLFDIAKSVQGIIYAHIPTLKGLLPDDINLEYGGKSVLANSLLVGTSSPYLYEALRRECMEIHATTLVLHGNNRETFEAAVEYIATGQISELWKRESDRILKILQGASKWEIDGLVECCAEVLKRYLTADNVGDYLHRSLVHGWEALTERCIEYINQRDIGAHLRALTSDTLEIELLNYRFQVIDLFETIKKFVTRIVFHGNLLMDERSLEILQETPQLVALNLSGTSASGEVALELPDTIEELDLSRCEWLSSALLEKIIVQAPHLIVLKLKNDLQLDYRSWALLQRLGSLEKLYVEGCHQLTDDDLLIIARGCPRLRFINLSECKKLTEPAFLEFANSMHGLVSLNLSNTLMSDIALIGFADCCPLLERINVSHCKNISDSGILEAVKIAIRLLSIDVTGCPVSEDVVKSIQRNRPHLQVIS